MMQKGHSLATFSTVVVEKMFGPFIGLSHLIHTTVNVGKVAFNKVNPGVFVFQLNVHASLHPFSVVDVHLWA